MRDCRHSILIPDGFAFLLRDRFEPSRPSSNAEGGTGAGVEGRPTMGEYERRPGVGAGENEETWRSMTNSCVAFVRCTIFARSVTESGLFAPPPFRLPLVLLLLVPFGVGVAEAAEVVPRVLSACESWMTV